MNASDDGKYKPPISEDLSARLVSEFMKTKILSATTATTLKTAINTMLSQHISAMPVVDQHGKCIGVFSEFDAMLQSASSSLDMPIHYSKNPITVTEDTRFRDALILLVAKRVKRLFVVDAQGYLTGVISRHDFMRTLFDEKK